MTAPFILQASALAVFFGLGVMHIGMALDDWASGFPLGVVGTAGMLITGLALSGGSVAITALYAFGAP